MNKFKKVLALRELGVEYREVSRLLEVPIGTINAIVCADRAKCKSVYEYNSHLARRKGYPDFNTYAKIREVLKSNLERIETLPPEELRKIAESNQPARQSDSPLYFAELRDEFERIMQIIRRLPNTQREVFTSLALEEKTGEQLAAEHGWSSRTRCYQLYKKALSNIRKNLGIPRKEAKKS